MAKESLERHKLAFTDRECDSQILRNPGFFHFRSGGEKHVNDPDSIAALQVRELEYVLGFCEIRDFCEG